jgi:hypothetical protein
MRDSPWLREIRTLDPTVNALASGLRATGLNARAAAGGGDPAEAAAGAVRLALLPDDGPSSQFFSWDGAAAPW